MSKLIDLTGQKFGKWSVIKLSHTNRRGEPYWNCICECGVNKVVAGRHLRSGGSKSCGCLSLEQKLKRFFKDLVGQRFGRLIAIYPTDDRINGCIVWLCRCDCGKEIKITSQNLQRGDAKSCGCLHKEKTIERSRLGYSVSSCNALYSSYKRTARKHSREFELSMLEFKFLTSNNCHYCGRGPMQVIKTRTAYGSYIYNGIDRVDNSKGYVLDNCVTCCGICNRMKRSLSKEEFLEHIRQIALHSNLNPVSDSVNESVKDLTEPYQLELF